MIPYTVGSGASSPPSSPPSFPPPSSPPPEGAELLFLVTSSFWMLTDFIIFFSKSPGVKMILRFFNVSVVTSSAFSWLLHPKEGRKVPNSPSWRMLRFPYTLSENQWVRQGRLYCTAWNESHFGYLIAQHLKINVDYIERTRYIFFCFGIVETKGRFWLHISVP